MGGIVFFGTHRLEDVKDFYIKEVGCDRWYDQGDCAILRHGNLLFGFCTREKCEREGMITFFYDRKEDVDGMYQRLSPKACAPPESNEKYHIYHFFLEDPEGRTVEFQFFENPIEQYLAGDQLLLTRRSIREFREGDVTDDKIEKVFEICRFAPTSMNTQSYYFKLIRERETLLWLSEIRGESSKPIGRAPMAVAVCSDPSLSRRHVQDGCIGAYHLILTAHFFGLGTCWIAAMDRDDVKNKLDIPREHYIATITPLGYPQDANVPAPKRKAASEFMR